MGHKISELSEALSLRKALTHTLRRQNTLEIPVQQRENSSKGGTPHEARQTEKVRECARIHVCRSATCASCSRVARRQPIRSGFIECERVENYPRTIKMMIACFCSFARVLGLRLEHKFRHCCSLPCVLRPNFRAAQNQRR